MGQISGSCLCGAIKYTCAAQAVMVAACHCSHCRKQSGSAFSVNVATPKLDWLKAGTLDDTSWVKPVANVWCSSAQTWVTYPEGVAKFPQSPPAA